MSNVKGRERMIREDPKDDRRGTGYERRFDEPRHMNCRVAISNLDEKVSREALEERFNKYGRVVGTSMHRGFAFVQYEMEDMAQAAIKQENESVFSGVKLDVRLAKDSRREEKPHFIPPVRRRSPPNKREYARDTYYRPAYRDRSPPRGGRESEDMFRRDGDPPARNQGRPDERYREGGSPKRDAPVSSGRPYSTFFDRRPDQRSPPLFRSRDPSGAFVDPSKPPQSNECEIIVTSKLLRPYADSVLWKLKSMGMAVDLLFPKEETPIMQILEAITARGCLYALVITSQNEIHKSLTVNILYGTPQEHRNMPLEDAMLLINRNYDNYKIEKASKMKLVASDMLAPVIPPGPTGNAVGSHVPPVNTGMDDVQILFRLLAEGKLLTISELDRVIRHLQECRDRLISAEGGTRHSSALNIGALSETLAQHVGNLQQNDLQQKIMNLISSNQNTTNRTCLPQVSSANESYDTRSAPINEDWRNASVPAVSNTGNGQPLRSPGASAAFINFDNPNIKKALDSLIQSGPNLLRTLGATTGGSGAATSSPLAGGGGVGSVGGNDMGSMYSNPYGANMLPTGNMGPLGGQGMGNMGPLSGQGMGNMGPLGSQGMGGMGPLGGQGMGNMGPLGGQGMGNIGPLYNSQGAYQRPYY